MTLPKIINPCPIKEATVEIRFESALPPDAIFGVVYNELKDSYKDSQALPILQIPELVRINDPNLAFQPHYRIKKDDFLLQIGPKMISLSVTEVYPTWEEYLKEMLDVFRKINKIGFISNIIRVGLRYINVFEIDILKQINLSITIKNSEISNKETFVRTLFEEKKFQTVLQIGNNLVLQKGDGSQIIGSIIDIDVSTMENGVNFFENMKPLLEEAHTVEKEKFFGLLKAEFLETLNPVY